MFLNSPEGFRISVIACLGFFFSFLLVNLTTLGVRFLGFMWNCGFVV